MHISEGVLSGSVLAAGAILAAGGVAAGLRKIDEHNIALCGVLSAAFFTASLIHVPVGLGNAHLVLCGLMGVLLGWASFPAILAALLLQAVLFQYGGLTTIGVNTFSMGFGAITAWYLFRAVMAMCSGRFVIKVAAFLGGMAGIAMASILAALALAFTDEGFMAAAGALLLAHLPIMFAEGLLTMLTVSFLARTRPQLVGACISRQGFS